MGFFAFYLSFCIFHQARHAFSNSLPKVKRDQAKILLASFLVAYFAALDFLPVFGIPFYPIRFIPFFIWLIITAYAIRHFKLLEVTPSIAAPAIIATLADPLFVTNAQGRVTIANQAAVNLLQTELKEVFNEPLVNFLPTASDLLEETKNLPIEKTTLISGREAVIKTKQGREIPVSVAVGVVRDEKGSPLGLAVICHSIEGLKKQVEFVSKQAKDLEETKVALLNVLEDDRELQQELRKEKTSVEEKVEERTKQLQKEQEALKETKRQVELGYLAIQKEKAKLESSINNLPIGFILTDAAEEILAVNEQAKGILGLSKAPSLRDIEKKLAGAFDLRNAFEKCRREGKTEGTEELAFEDKFLRIVLTPILMPHDHREFIGIVILIEDITQAKLLERSKDEFFAVAAHDMRTPLTAIRGNASMILQYFAGKLKDPSLREMVSDIHEASTRLINLVNDYLDTAKLEQQKIEFVKETFDLPSLVQEAIDQLKNTAAAKGLYLRLEKPKEELSPAVADKARTNQILFNLLGNAIKFTQKGGVQIKITRDGGFLAAWVVDTGVGVSSIGQRMLFKKFQQAGEQILTRETTGSGLGLYIAKLLVEGMGGKIYLESSEVGKGSSFVFTLPTAKEEMVSAKIPVP